MSFYVTRDLPGRGSIRFMDDVVIFSCSARKANTGLPYEQDIKHSFSYETFVALTDITLAPGERKCVELVEVRERSR